MYVFQYCSVTCARKYIHIIIMFFTQLEANASLSTITGLSIQWTNGNFTSLQVSWDPLTPPQGGGVTYRVSYAPVLANVSLMRACMKELITTDTKVSSTLLSGLEPKLFYSVMVEVIIQNGLLTDSGKPIHTCCAIPCTYQIYGYVWKC